MRRAKQLPAEAMRSPAASLNFAGWSRNTSAQAVRETERFQNCRSGKDL